ncbi:MAG: DUF3052 family protein [Phycisphaerae bacterium]
MDAECKLRVGNEQYVGKARIDDDYIDFVGPTKFRFRLSEIREPAFSAGALRFEFHGNKIAINVGERTGRWYDSVVHPKSPAQKLGVRPGESVRLVNIDDESIILSLREARVQMTTDRAGVFDHILLGVERPADLRQVSSLAETLPSQGILWICIPKANRAVTQSNVIAAARAVGLSDIKDVSLSETYQAHKLARPVIARRKGAAVKPRASATA